MYFDGGDDRIYNQMQGVKREWDLEENENGLDLSTKETRKPCLPGVRVGRQMEDQQFHVRCVKSETIIRYPCGDSVQDIDYSNLQFRGEVWARDRYYRVIGIQTEIIATGEDANEIRMKH